MSGIALAMHASHRLQ